MYIILPLPPFDCVYIHTDSFVCCCRFRLFLLFPYSQKLMETNQMQKNKEEEITSKGLNIIVSE